MQSYVFVHVERCSDETTWSRLLGELHEVFARGLTIGSDAGCTVVLDVADTAPWRVRVTAGANHVFVVRRGADGVERGDRVDSGRFAVPGHSVRVERMHLDSIVKRLLHPATPTDDEAHRRRVIDGFSKAAADLVRLAPVARPAIPRLLCALFDADTDVARRAGLVLEAIGGLTAGARPTRAELFERLAQLVADADVGVRREAALRLTTFDEEAAVAAPALRAAFGDPDFEVRVRAARALWSIARDAAAVLPALTAALERILADAYADASPPRSLTMKRLTRDAIADIAAEGLGAMGAVSAIPLLARACRSEFAGPYGAARALAKLGPEGIACLERLAEAERKRHENGQATFAIEELASGRSSE